MTTISARSDSARNAAATDSCRRAPPATTRSGFAVFVRYAGGRLERSAGNATITSSTSGCSSSSVTLRSSIVRPAIDRNCLGCPAPRRSPLPPAATMAATYILGIISRFRVVEDGVARRAEELRERVGFLMDAVADLPGERRERPDVHLKALRALLEKPDGHDAPRDDDHRRQPALVSIHALIEA